MLSLLVRFAVWAWRRATGRTTRAFVSKAAVVAGIGGVLAVSLIVTTPSNAQAFVVGPALPPVIGAVADGVGGAGIAGVGADALAVLSGPVGWGILAAAGVAATLYATKDTWIPWVNNLVSGGKQPWGTGPNTLAPPGGSGMVHTCCFTITKAELSGNSVIYHMNGSDPNNLGMVALRSWCKRSDGSVYKTDKGDGAFSLNPGGLDWTRTYQVCNTSETVIGTDVGNPICGNGAEFPYACGSMAVYGPQGLDQTAGDQSGGQGGFDPRSAAAKYHTSTDCIKPDGTVFTIGADWDGTSAGAVLPSCAAVSPGSHAKTITITGTNPNDGTQTQLWQAKPTVSDPQCDPQQAHADPCMLEVLIDGKPCTVGVLDCENWATINQTAPNRVQCRLGSQIVATSECNALERAYESKPVWGTLANTDGDPSTRSDQSTDVNGQAQPDNPSSTPTTSGGPATGAQTTPSVDPKSDDCFPTGWGVFNPLEWVYKPTMCALRDAFVPKTSSVTDLQTEVQTDVNATGIGDTETAVGAMFAPLSNGSGCAGPTLHFGMEGVSQDVQPFNACSQPMATVASIANVLATVVISVLGGLTLLRALSSAFGYNFSIGGKGGSE